MRYRLRTLMILLAVMPPALAWGWREYTERQRRQAQTLPSVWYGGEEFEMKFEPDPIWHEARQAADRKRDN